LFRGERAKAKAIFNRSGSAFTPAFGRAVGAFRRGLNAKAKALAYPRSNGNSKGKNNNNDKSQSRSFDSGGRCAAFAQDDTSISGWHFYFRDGISISG
jgi:hypothetical protein